MCQSVTITLCRLEESHVKLTRRNIFAFVTSLALVASMTACSKTSAVDSASCTDTVTPDTLTIATGDPAYSPWVADDKPESGKGFEAAVAYAVAGKLGYTNDQVKWVRTSFDSAIAPGKKNFDFNIQQFTITDERKKAVDFSSPYYTAPQAIVTYAGSPIEDFTSLAELKNARLGVGIGTTSLDAAKEQIGVEPQVFNDNAAGVTALKNGQVDGLVVDLPTALYLAAVEVENGKVLGQLPSSGGGDEFGLLLAKDSPLTQCVSDAVDSLKKDGALDTITQQWMETDSVALVLK